MVGTSLTKFFKRKKFGKLITINRSRLNLENYNQVEKFIRRKKPDIIINCAGRVGGIMANSTYPIEFLYENILIQLNLIKSAYKNNIKHFINLGSSCIYPKNAKQPIKEEYLLSSKLEKTNEAYALAKIACTKYCQFVNNNSKLNYKTVMPCNVYGPNEEHKGDMRSVVSKAYEQIAETGRMTLFRSHHPDYRDGEQKRDFLYVKDAVLMTLWLAENEQANGLFNLGNGTARTWLDLGNSIFSALGLEPNVEFVDMPEILKDKYQYFTEARMERLRKAGYMTPFTNIEDGVRQYVQNFLSTKDPYI